MTTIDSTSMHIRVVRFTMITALFFFCMNSFPNLNAQENDSKALDAQLDEILLKSQSNDDTVQTQATCEIRQLVQLRDKHTASFAKLEEGLIQSLTQLFKSQNAEDHKKAFHQIVMLGELRSSKSIPLLVEHLTFENPYVTTYQRGPFTYTEPEPKDLPVFAALLKTGPDAIEVVFQRAISVDDSLIHSVCAELLMFHYKFKGALMWLDEALGRGGLTNKQLSRVKVIKDFVETRR